MKIIIILCFLLAILGCQTSQDIAGSRHESAISKWKALAKFSDSDLSKFGVMITADFEVINLTNTPSYLLSKIKLNVMEAPHNINLVTPTFKNKIICSLNCVLFNELYPAPYQQSQTMLQTYFDKYEFQIFNFYAEIFKFNERLALLDFNSEEEIEAYLAHLLIENKVFSSLKGFTQYYNNKFTQKQFDEFKLTSTFNFHKISLKNQYLKSYILSSLLKNRNELSQFTGTNEQAAETLVWENNINKNETLLWEDKLKQNEMEHWIDTPNIEMKLWPTSVITVNKTDVINKWSKKEGEFIRIGDLVCSYDDNFFGIAQTIDSATVEVTLIGQGKKYNDGIVMNLASGSLWLNVEQQYFVEASNIKTFSKTDLFKCLVE